MSHSQEFVARTTLRFAGVFQEITEVWSKRLDSYFNQLDSLIQGEWLSPEDLRGILTESKLAAREALNGLGTDLSAQLVHESSGIFSRFEMERYSLSEEIMKLRAMLQDLTSSDEYSAQTESLLLRKAILSIPDFQVLQLIQILKNTSYNQLMERTSLKKSELRKIMKSLAKLGHVHINKKKRPYVISFVSAPWLENHIVHESEEES